MHIFDVLLRAAKKGGNILLLGFLILKYAQVFNFL